MLKELLKLDHNIINTIFHDQKTDTTLNLITLATSKNKKNIIEILLSEGGDVNCQTSSNGDTEMNIAIRNDNLQIAEIILKNEKYDVGIQNKSGETAFHMAKEKKGKIFFQLLAKEQNIFNKNANNNLIKMNTPNEMKNNFLNNIPHNNNLLLNNIPSLTNKKKKKEKANEIEINQDKIHNNNNNNNNNNNDNNNNNNTNNNSNNNKSNNNNNNIYISNQKKAKDDLIILIEFKSFDYSSYFSIGQDIKLYLNLFQIKDILYQRIEELEKIKRKNRVNEKLRKLNQRKTKRIKRFKS